MFVRTGLWPHWWFAEWLTRERRTIGQFRNDNGEYHTLVCLWLDHTELLLCRSTPFFVHRWIHEWRSSGRWYSLESKHRRCSFHLAVDRHVQHHSIESLSRLCKYHSQHLSVTRTQTLVSLMSSHSTQQLTYEIFFWFVNIGKDFTRISNVTSTIQTVGNIFSSRKKAEIRSIDFSLSLSSVAVRDLFDRLPWLN